MQLANIRLSDQGIFWALGHLSASQRAARFPWDFESHGGIRQARVPQDPPLIRNSTAKRITSYVKVGAISPSPNRPLNAQGYTMTSTSGSGLLSPLKQVHNAVNPSTQSSRQNTPLHQDKIKADSSAVSSPGCEELVQLYKKVAVYLSSQLETEANDMELEVQNHDVQHLLTRIKYWKLKQGSTFNNKCLKSVVVEFLTSDSTSTNTWS
ncbi:uncharacterized protein N7484_002188 [Penicillium longicatenatum]|uniref:uncharacterized protein n=1 Tax=Penicillium longicatenatum TaxID=1561947 RepID=UPI00254663B3|nr:uncharacterized protein N7484_002188 [Penicillium longicatenatum]KAJ5658539.1 hypothetical protein N7484_002188 [Penicillium longicatenatum]